MRYRVKRICIWVYIKVERYLDGKGNVGLKR